jgi:PAS domain-containing protein
MENTDTLNTANLRRKAEEVARKRFSIEEMMPSASGMMKLIQELEVHQVELEMQSEELRKAKDLAEAAVEKYALLYDFSPTGYFTLSKEGSIIGFNLSAAKILREEPARLRNNLFSFFISNDTKPIFNRFLRKVFESSLKETCEITISRNGELEKYISLSGIAIEKGEQCIVAAADVTERKLAVEAMRETRILVQTLVQNIPDLILLKDKEGVNLTCKTLFERFFGAGKTDSIEKPVTAL